MLKPGLYEQVIDKELSNELDGRRQLIEKRNIDKAEAPHATFENYWNSTDFSQYSPDDGVHLMQL